MTFWPNACGRCCLKPPLQKRLGRRSHLLRKTPRLFRNGGPSGITVWTKWYPASPVVTRRMDGKGGNRRGGDAPEHPWENLLDLSHNLYSKGCHLCLFLLFTFLPTAARHMPRLCHFRQTCFRVTQYEEGTRARSLE